VGHKVQTQTNPTQAQTAQYSFRVEKGDYESHLRVLREICRFLVLIGLRKSRRGAYCLFVESTWRMFWTPVLAAYRSYNADTNVCT